MPYPSKLDTDTLIETAWQMMENDGVEAFSMHKLAAHFGVKTPSLYRYCNRVGLLQQVNQMTERKLFSAISEPLALEAPPQTIAIAIMERYREFALSHPTTYGLLYTNTIEELRPEFEEGVQGVLPIQAVVAQLSGEAHSLSATRGLLAIAHGFVMLEITGILRRGGELSEAYRYTLETYIRGMSID